MSHSTKPIWWEIKISLENLVINGTYQCGSKLPSITEITKLFGCSPGTAQKVLSKLVEEGVATLNPGCGYFVMPYVKNKLQKKHTEYMEEDIKTVFLNAKKYGYQKAEIEGKMLEIAKQVW